MSKSSTTQKTPKTKPSGVEWLGDIPGHWEVIKAKWVLKNISRKGYPRESLLSATQDRGVIPRDTNENRVVMPTGQLSSFKLVEKDDFVISLRSFQGGIEHCAYRGIVSPAYTVLKNTGLITTGYLRLLLKTPRFIAELNISVKGIRQGKNIDYADFAETTLPIPPKPEQDKIVAFLDRKTAQIDALIEKKQRLLKLLDEQLAIKINNAVTKGIVNAQYGTLNPHLSTKSTPIYTTHTSPLKNSGIEWIGEIPEDWKILKLRHLLRQSPKNGISPANNDSGKTPTLSIAAVKKGSVKFKGNTKYTKLSSNLVQQYSIEKGDMLALRGNGSIHLVGSAGIVLNEPPAGCIYPDLLIRLHPNSLIKPTYLVTSLNNSLRDAIQLSAKTSAGIWKISGERLSAIKTPTPPISEQNSIIDHINESIRQDNQTRKATEHMINSLHTTRQKLKVLDLR